jgi:O-phospho-L-seryl-tRNASec:L-selenocysteinyl-tRNA synthase
MYPGRASMGPILDMFITLLSMGENGYKNLLNERIRILPILKQGLEKFANLNNEIILNSPGIYLY